jgi:hypothetical protein
MVPSADFKQVYKFVCLPDDFEGLNGVNDGWGFFKIDKFFEGKKNPSEEGVYGLFFCMRSF